MNRGASDLVVRYETNAVFAPADVSTTLTP